MVFRLAFRSRYLALLLCLLGAPVMAQDWQVGYEGIYIKARFGGLIAHPYTLPVDIAIGNNNYRPKIHTRLGFTTHLALGAWFNFFDVGRLRSELEAGYMNYALAGRPKIAHGILGPEQGRGAVTAITIFWYNYYNILPRSSAHQPWVGFGFGGARWQLTYYYRGARDQQQRWDEALGGALGYDYRLTDQFAIGIAYRYMHVLSPRALRSSQLLIAVSYGF